MGHSVDRRAGFVIKLALRGSGYATAGPPERYRRGADERILVNNPCLSTVHMV